MHHLYCCVLCAAHQSDPELLEALNELRIGRMSTATQLLLSELQRPLPDDGIAATHLYPHKVDVSEALACRGQQGL